MEEKLRIGNSLARALVATKGNLILVVGWSLDVLRLLGDQSDSALVAFCWDDSDSLSFSSVWLRRQYISPSIISKQLVLAYSVVDESSVLYFELALGKPHLPAERRTLRE